MADDTMAPGKRAGLLAYLSCIRYREVLLLQGSPLFGAAFAIPHLAPETALATGAFLLASMLLVAHIFSLNDWAGISADRNDPNKAADVFLTKGLTRRAVLTLSLGLLAASLLIFALVRLRTLPIAAAIAILGMIYSHPAVNAKGTPLLSSTPHLLGGLLHFLLGYALFAPVDARGVLIALYFALTFTAGHLNQEVRDHEGDRASGIRTNAVGFGERPAFVAGFAVFTIAYAHLGVLAWTGLVPRAIGLALLLYPLHAYWTWRTWQAGLGFATITRLQARYRAIYGVIGLLMLAALAVA